MTTAAHPAQKEISVKIGAFPGGKINSYSFPEGATYRDGLTKAGLIDSTKSDELDIRVNGKPQTDILATMNNAEQILLFKKVRGN